MVIFIPITLLLFTAAGIFLASRFNPKFAYFWLIAFTGSISSWTSAIVLKFFIPFSVTPFNWSKVDLFTITPEYILDSTSWQILFAMLTIQVSVLLIDTSFLEEGNWFSWAGTMVICAIGGFTVLSGNFLSLIICWTWIDIFELVLLLFRAKDNETKKNILFYSFTNFGGTMLVLFSWIIAISNGESFSFSSIPPISMILLLGAIMLRLGVFPLHVLKLHEPFLHRGLGTTVRLITPATSFYLAIRIAEFGIPENVRWAAFVIFLVPAIYGLFIWLSAKDELNGRSGWTLILAIFILISSIFQLPMAALVWALIFLYTGSLIFLSPFTNTALWVVSGVSVLFLVNLYFSPGYTGSAMYRMPWYYSAAVIPIQALLVLGFVKHTYNKGKKREYEESWMLLLYNIGLIVLPAGFIIASLLDTDLRLGWTTNGSFWLSFAVILFSAGLGYLSKKVFRIPERITNRVNSLSLQKHMIPIGKAISGGVNSIFSIPTKLLESRGGTLWTLLFLALVISLLAQNFLFGE
ncbi:MAG: hypothetical protein JXA19_06440 [Anaerolineales bacterium]|nr:hypothetical protein [Anaerolineales bacterium]